ncbi:MAG: hypothetical protein AAF235_00590 [Planctomycetota bacterium]
MTQIQSDYSGVVTPTPPPVAHGAGPVMTDDAYAKYLDKLGADPLLQGENVRVSEASAAGVSKGLLGLGALCLAGTLFGAFAVNPAHALAAYKVGVFTALACCLGAWFLVMVFHATNSYWGTTIRRQLEHIMGLTWLPTLLIAPIVIVELASGGILMTWMLEQKQGTFLIEHKIGYLNDGFFVIRYIICAAIWVPITRQLLAFSKQQDITGDRFLSRKMRRLSSIGLLLFALSVPFAAFDHLMSMDYRFFSTMWGVYYFAGAIMSGVALSAVVLAVLRFFGRLNGVVTKEHFHDHGKLLFAFMVFWAYIGFSQYFLIWYSNIPEETAYFVHRQQGGWEVLSMLLVLLHFVAPFPLLISRNVKKSTLGLGLFGAFLLITQVMDMIWIIRPMVYLNTEWAAGRGDPSVLGWVLDAVAIVGVLGVFIGLLVREIASGPLVPMKDPKLGKALKHANYV